MTLKNKYVKRSKISEAKFRQLIKLFAHDLDAQTISSLTKLNRNTVNRYLMLIRARIAEFCESQSPCSEPFEGKKSCLESVDRKNKRSRAAIQKTPVFGIHHHNGSVYTEIVPDSAKAVLKGVIRGAVDPETLTPEDGWHCYDVLVDPGYKKHFQVNHGKDDAGLDRSHLNRIESFWGYAKQHLMKFHGIAESTFYLHLKECEFRFNFRNENIYSLLLKMFRERPLS
ncbi:hypothetical protein D3OALGA1CA_2800 [Olavius algarvensis associated proteobacterium Delta 3]|nr:hypothetical protein D3OALGA1CA_2800 [Olavius algarvensis associated proteobacterium Delta 3]CAB5164012.1 hypothetical protein D3OALGB2SA_5624 [Olavius algarvensis associated proteobacterium Delta 3]